MTWIIKGLDTLHEKTCLLQTWLSSIRQTFDLEAYETGERENLGPNVKLLVLHYNKQVIETSKSKKDHPALAFFPLAVHKTFTPVLVS